MSSKLGKAIKVVGESKAKLNNMKILKQGVKISATKYGIKIKEITKIIGPGDLKVILPYKVQKVISLDIKEDINTHGSIKLKCIIEEDVYKKVLSFLGSKEKIEVNYEDKNIFIGVITNEKIRCQREVYYLEIEAKSFTSILDIKKHTRIFPSGDMSYKEIIDYVLKDYSRVNYIGSLNKKAEGIVVQYRETDFEFIMRLVSHANLSLLPDSSEDKPRFKIGTLENSPQTIIEQPEYSITKDLKKYHKVNSTTEKELNEQRFTCYIFKSMIPLKLGHKIKLNNKTLYINKVEGEIKNSGLEYTYTAGEPESLMEGKILNKDITGASFKAKVTSINKDEMKVKFNMDMNTESIFLKYLTPFALEGDYGWFISPEVNDTVTVQFPNENSESAYILSSNRMSGGGDPSTKSLSTPYGKSMTLSPSSINFSCDGGSINITDSDISFQSPKDVSIDASNNAKMGAGNITMSGGSMTQLIGAGSSIILDGDINGSGGEVII